MKKVLKKIVPLIAGALSLGLMFSSVIPASAATNDKSVDQKTVNKDESEINKQKIKEMRKQVKFENKKAEEGNTYTEASLNIDGIEAVIILDDGQELTDEMLTKTAKKIEEEKMAADLRTLSEALQPIPNTETSAKIPVESAIDVTPYIVAPPETDGYLLGQHYHSFSNVDAAVANTLFKAALGGIFTYAAIKIGNNTLGAIAIGALAAVSGDYQPFQAHWTRESVWESWSSYSGCYFEDMSITHYTSSSFSTAKSVFFKYDVRRYSSVF